MAHIDDTLTRRQLIKNLAFAATAASVSGAGCATDAQVGDPTANAKVKAVLDELLKTTPEVGLQVAAYLDNKLVIDTWAGLADEDKKKPVDGDTMFMLSSTTKGVTATCMHLLVEKHKLDYDMPIVKVWPEFGAHGKEAATLRHALAHRTGVPQTPVGYTPDWLADWDKMCRGIADLKPMFPVGQRTAYHSLNYGHINGEILRRVDGRTINQFLQDEICKPLRSTASIWGFPTPNCRAWPSSRTGRRPRLTYDASMVGEPAGSYVAKVFNRRDVQQAADPGIGRHHERSRSGASLRDAGQLGRTGRRADPA